MINNVFKKFSNFIEQGKATEEKEKVVPILAVKNHRGLQPPHPKYSRSRISL